MSADARRRTPKKRYSIQLATGSRVPSEAWVELRHEGGRPYRYVDAWEAEQVQLALHRRQPHLTYRIHVLPE